METYSIRPETIVSGFSHFAWVTMCALLAFDINPARLVHLLAPISSGGAVLVGSLLFGASFFCGKIVDSITSFVFSRRNRGQTQVVTENSAKNESRLAKVFLFSMSIAGLFALASLFLLDTKYDAGQMHSAILLMGIPLEVVALIATYCQWRNSKKA